MVSRGSARGSTIALALIVVLILAATGITISIETHKSPTGSSSASATLPGSSSSSTEMTASENQSQSSNPCSNFTSGAQSQSQASSTSYVSNTITSVLPPEPEINASTTSSSGIELTESVNATTIGLGERLFVNMSIANVLPKVNVLNASESFPFSSDEIDFTTPDCFYPEPADFVIIPGNYTLQQLALVAPPAGTCGSTSANSFSFQPNSDIVTINGTFLLTQVTQIYGPYHLDINGSTVGSFGPDFPFVPLESFSDYPTPFSPGIYTVALGDEWGQGVVLHVTVLNGTTSGPSSVSLADENGLNLDLDIEPNSSGQSISIAVQGVNRLDSLNCVSKGGDWPTFYPHGYTVSGDQVLNPVGGCSIPEPVGFAIFSGYYDSGDFGFGNDLGLFKPEQLLCITTSGAPPTTSYAFQPQSDNMTIYANNQFAGKDTVVLSLSTGGYWTENSVFEKFSPGLYTVMGGDEWGDVAFLYFLVSSNGTISAGDSIVAAK